MQQTTEGEGMPAAAVPCKQIKWFQSGIISCSLSNIQNNQIEILRWKMLEILKWTWCYHSSSSSFWNVDDFLTK